MTYYARLEPFGEERHDLRMANLLRWDYDSKRGKKGRALALGSLTLYEDMRQAATEADNRRELEAILSRFAVISR